MLKIEEPTKELFSNAKSGLLEVLAYPTPFDIGGALKAAEYATHDFDGYIDYLNKNKSKDQPKGRVPSTTLWLFDDEKFIGLFDVRHSLNEVLKQQGGHIAYYIIPSCRGNGYTLRGLKLVLAWCKENLGLDEAWLFCNKENNKSYRVLEHALKDFGGQRLREHIIDGHIECGYIIKIPQ